MSLRQPSSPSPPSATASVHASKIHPGEKVLVVCIDRDDDIGRKTGIKGPIVGAADCLEAATRLAAADPTDTDSNTVFDAVKTARELGGGTEVALLTGSEKVGVESDVMVGAQLDQVLASGKYDGIVLVSDGADDEQVIPLVQSRLKIISVKRFLVRQAENAESVFYTGINFLKRTFEEPSFARLFLALPGVAILIITFFGLNGWRFVFGLVGGYLLIKGLQLEHSIFSFFEDLVSSFSHRRLSFLMYMLSMILFALSIFQGSRAIPQNSANLLVTVSTFVYAWTFMFIISGACLVIGRTLDVFPDTSKMFMQLNAGVLFGVTVMVLRALSNYFLDPLFGLPNFVTTVVLALIFVLVIELIKRLTIK